MATVIEIYGHCSKCRNHVWLKTFEMYEGVELENHTCPSKGCDGVMEYDSPE